jgi:hypothetical protein
MPPLMTLKKLATQLNPPCAAARSLLRSHVRLLRHQAIDDYSHALGWQPMISP